MSEILHPNPHGPLDPHQLTAFEAVVGAALPDEYRRFLAAHNGGTPMPPEVILPGRADPFTSLAQAFGLHGADGDLAVVYSNCRGVLPANLVAFAEDYGGNLFCVGVRGECRGRVYFWNHDLSWPGDDEPGWDALTLLAGSFNSFVPHLGRAQPGA